MPRISLVAALILLIGFIAWTPVAYLGMPRASTFGVRWSSVVSAGIVSYQPWKDPSGEVHPFKVFGEIDFSWNETSVANGHQAGNYNFSMIPNLVGIEWTFQAKMAKVEDGTPIYVFYSKPFPWAPPQPFNGLKFIAHLQSHKVFLAHWANNTKYLTIPEGVANETQTLSWPDADWSLGAHISLPTKETLETLPANERVDITFETSWDVSIKLSEPHVGFSEYDYGFQKTARVEMKVWNETVLLAKGSFIVQSGDTPTVPITYRSLDPQVSTLVTFGLASVSSAALMFAFRQKISDVLHVAKRKLSQAMRLGPTNPPKFTV